MKLSIFLPILAAGANKRKKNNEGNRGFVPRSVTNQCSDQVPSSGGYFDVTNNGLSGSIALNEYQDDTNCKHVVEADISCAEIRVQLRSVAVEPNRDCSYDHFRFGWTDWSTGWSVTEPRCNCYGDGCQKAGLTYTQDYYQYHEDYFF